MQQLLDITNTCMFHTFVLHTVKPAIRGHTFKRGSIHVNFFMTGRGKGDLLIHVLFNRGDHMGRFDLIEVTTWAGLT